MHQDNNNNFNYKRLKDIFCPTKNSALNVSLVVLMLVLPYIIFHWMLPTFSDLTIGNDYQVFPIQQQVELQYGLEKGEVPLYVPGFAEGHSASALTLGQMYHPVRWLAAKLPGYWNGQALTANTIVKLLGIGLVHIFVFLFFRRLSLRRDLSFIFSFITVYNMRMLDMFRYGASLENYLAYVLVCVMLGFFYIYENMSVGALTIALSTFLLCVGGHPQIMYLGLLGVGFCYAVLPFVISAICPTYQLHKKRLLRFYGFSALWILAGLGLSAMYIFPFYQEFVRANASRMGQDYAWSLAFFDTWGGSLGSFFRPLNAAVTGAFGGSALLVVGFIFPIALAAGKRFSWSVGLVWLFGLIVFLVSLGEATPLHRVFWEYFPLANSFRVPGRVTMMMAVPSSLVLAWLFCGRTNAIRIFKLPLGAWVSSLAIVVLLAYTYLLADKVPEPSHYIPARILDLPVWVEWRVFELGLILLVLLTLHSGVTALAKWPRLVYWSRLSIGVLLVMVTVGQTGICMRYGTWVAKARDTFTMERLDAGKSGAVRFIGNAGFGMELPLVATQMSQSILDTKLARFYRNMIPVAQMDNSYDIIAARRSDEVVIETTKAATLELSKSGVDEVELVMNTFNTLTFKVDAGMDGVMTINYPFLPGWTAILDDKSISVHRANGYQMGVYVPKGQHSVRFVYTSSSATAGIIVALVTLCGLLGFVIFVQIKKRWIAGIVSAVVLIGAVGVFVWWSSSLRGETSLNTKFRWTSAQVSDRNNLAFASTTQASSIHLGQMPYYHYAGRAVDGMAAGRGWMSHRSDRSPYWQIDLGKPTDVHLLRLHKVSSNVALPQRPLHIQFSDNGITFTLYQSLTKRSQRGLWEIPLTNINTRIIRLWSPGGGQFGIGEVEIY